MNTRWLAPQAAASGMLLGTVVFVALHLALDATPLGATLLVVIATAVTGTMLWLIRRAELLRTRQAQGYFIAALMIAGILLIMLPPGELSTILLPDALNTTTATGQ